jgi:transcriptional regulator with XRE-family HTH domain
MSLGERIAARRQELGWSQLQLAQEAGLTPSAISLFESEKRNPSFNALQRLSKALRVPADYFTGVAESTHQIRPGDPRLDRVADVFSLLDSTGRDYLLETALQVLARRAGGSRMPSVSDDPRQAARDLLGHLGLQFPSIDPLLVACMLGITVRVTPIADADFEGLLDTSAVPPVMLLAVNETGKFNENRLRFTTAHLLAHYVLERHRSGVYRCRSLWAAGVENAEEKEANEFAAELLAPSPQITRFVQGLAQEQPHLTPMESALRLASRFKVSVPDGILQYARYCEQPCVALLTEGDRIRDVATSPSFQGQLVAELPPSARCITTISERGIQRQECPAELWGYHICGLVLEESYHYNASAQQSVTLLTLK